MKVLHFEIAAKAKIGQLAGSGKSLKHFLEQNMFGKVNLFFKNNIFTRFHVKHENSESEEKICLEHKDFTFA